MDATQEAMNSLDAEEREKDGDMTWEEIKNALEQLESDMYDYATCHQV